MRWIVLSLAAVSGCALLSERDPAPATVPTSQAAVATAPASPMVELLPTTRLGSASSGSYMTLGTLVAEANGKPIFADKVLAQLESPLAASARQNNARTFRTFATQLIRAKVMEEIRDELEFASAQRALSDEDRRLADGLTMQWRAKRISEAGGSEAVARARILRDEGMDLDEAVSRQHRAYMIQIHYQRKLLPLVQVSADELRHYYNMNPREFAQPAAARFRVIKFQAAAGARDAAARRAAEALGRAKAQHDFADLAATYNDDPQLKKDKGLIDWTPQGTYSVKAVDDAVWKLEADGVSGVLDESDALYLVKLEARRSARQAPFDEPAVQESIRNKLVPMRFNQLRDSEQKRLWNAGFIRFNDVLLASAVDMAMQKYRLWGGRPD
jgi:parvulin-like peptidyl-prolyl isomerase